MNRVKKNQLALSYEEVSLLNSTCFFRISERETFLRENGPFMRDFAQEDVRKEVQELRELRERLSAFMVQFELGNLG